MDAIVMRFTTGFFDVTKERRNDINPIYGQSLLFWLAEKLKNQVAVPAPQAEDWGWYVHIDWGGRGYMLGASASDEENGMREWVLQVVKQRTLSERLFGQAKMSADDDCAVHLRRLLEEEPAFGGVTVD